MHFQIYNQIYKYITYIKYILYINLQIYFVIVILNILYIFVYKVISRVYVKTINDAESILYVKCYM